MRSHTDAGAHNKRAAPPSEVLHLQDGSCLPSTGHPGPGEFSSGSPTGKRGAAPVDSHLVLSSGYWTRGPAAGEQDMEQRWGLLGLHQAHTENFHFLLHCREIYFQVTACGHRWKSQLYEWLELPTVSLLWVLWFPPPPITEGREGAGQVGCRAGVVLALRKTVTLVQEEFSPGWLKWKGPTTPSVEKGVKQSELSIVESISWSHQLQNSQQIPAMALAIPLLGGGSEETHVYAMERHVQGSTQCYTL